MTKSTCIIIDDEKLARDLLREYLESMEDIELLDECSKGSEAVEKINKLKPDLIFLDVQMPGMTGFEVLDEIDHEPYVIFITAYDQYAIRAFEKNAVDYLLKPLDEDRFRQAITRALKRKKNGRWWFRKFVGQFASSQSQRLIRLSHICSKI